MRGEAGSLLPDSAPPDLLTVNRTPVELDYIRFVPVSLQMGIWWKIVIKELNYWWMVVLLRGF